jgi:GcrA cell cycle regulator
VTTMFDWRPTSFGRHRKALPAEGRRWKDGGNYRHDAWTREQLDTLSALIADGTDYTTIAQRLGRSRDAVITTLKRLGMARVTTAGNALTALGVARVLGLPSSKTVAGWIARGWLRATNAGTATRAIHRVQWTELERFMADDQCWMAWDPATIPDAALREWATELRVGRPRWLSVGAVCDRYHVDRRTVNAWIVRLRVLPAVRYGNWWIRESDLDGWVLPSERPQRRRRRATRA